MKKHYVKPLVEKMLARVETGFAGSGYRTIYVGSNEHTYDNGHINTSAGSNFGGDDGNTEHIGEGSIIDF